MNFRIKALPLERFTHLFALDDAALAERGARRIVSDGGAPCRVSLEDAGPGERLILTHFEHHAVDTPFRASHAIFVREGARQAVLSPGEVPAMLRTRMLSVRAFDTDGMMLDADVTDGGAVEGTIARLLGDPAVDYIHLHFAKQGCYAARVVRA
jgi:Protein of unknown function (DUF1203)